jgi:hypothetical protein
MAWILVAVLLATTNQSDRVIVQKFNTYDQCREAKDNIPKHSGIEFRCEADL